ncbi:KAT8 regulatory NSL complex subunit 1 [Contarinia nasturtii]|uniref:KAT8 regulatory NSL complex subunit 1 n=1 Tax=Contarinia nasturtii TaxID=265458 RepID=UPI0012D3C166|nr:KAT8 regulatory NSL complex subunit 1 [Contarinia nasturtii]XP_031633685.1 KAT8 regulatory NSL complex subunit 1 [Contarinia nasturtii]XP_031633686.1 KAT8 regulatory NSL complex subunit 1 [Contarinia nasturtii]XP_031633687.1 KAT8 regulatory NSL complex subunit 1 [Contarinia nasturtii]
MDQQSNDKSIVTDHFQQQQTTADNDLLNAIVQGTEANNQLDCGIDSNIQATVEQLLAETHPQEFQQLQQELLQQQSSDQQLTFALQQTQYQSSQPMDLLMSTDPHQSQQVSNISTRNDDGHGMNTNSMNALSHPMQSEMDQMLDIDFMHQVLNSFESERAGENLDDLALFNDIGDVMNIGLDDVVSTSMSRESRTQEILSDIEKKREQMIRDCDFMMRRLRKIQVRHMGRHVSEEIGGLFEYAQQQIKRKERETKSISTMTPINQLHSDKQKMNWKMLLKRIEHAATNQHSNTAISKMLNTNSSTDQHHANNSGVSTSGAANKPSVISCVPPFDVNGYKQLRRCAGMLSTELKMVGRSFDPDATESSSGGESGDEGITYPNQTKHTLSIGKRAAYRWARDRAKIASRWTWLLAQISDLEYRIRQHQELYILLKKSNGQVTFEDGEPVASTSTSEIIQTPSVNGYRGLLPGSVRLGDMDDVTAKLYGGNSNDEVELNGSARTRAFKASAFKKRKLLQSTNLHKISRRAARPCTIKCGCRWPVHPCLLCTGRTDPTAPRDLPDMMSTQENVALLDPCYHPILSFPEDVAQNIYMEATLRTAEWQTKVARTSSKAVIKNALALQKANERNEARNNLAATASRKNSEATHSINSKKLSPNKFKLNATKLKKSQNNITNRKPKKITSGLNASKVKKNKSRKNSHMSATSSDHHDMDVGSPNGSISRSKNPSPIPGHSHRYERLHSERRNNKNAYDIDNIVIPSTVSSRVEILSYKEIPTPKWRIIEDEAEKINTTSQKEPEKEVKPEKSTEVPNTNVEEDISDDAYQKRHDRALNEERNRFITFLKFPYSTRSRANRRIDSQSSGANTPDPMSPAPSTPAAATNVDQESAPPTPQSVDAPADSAQESAKHNNNNTSVNNNGGVNAMSKSKLKQESRRMNAFRKAYDQREELLRRSTTPEIKETTPPYEPLNFPLPCDTLDQMIQSMPKTFKDIINDCIDQVAGDNLPAQSTAADHTPTQITTLAPNCKSRLRTQQYSDLTMLVEEDSDEETELAQEDANDPEWNFEPPQRIQKLQ